jgi:23S rRNA pseudouridine2604 synthase
MAPQKSLMLLLILLLSAIRPEETRAFSFIINAQQQQQQQQRLIQKQRAPKTTTTTTTATARTRQPAAADARDDDSTVVVAAPRSSAKRRNINETSSSIGKKDSSSSSSSNGDKQEKGRGEQGGEEEGGRGAGGDARGGGGIRLNKAFTATHSRRQADALIQDGGGRVRVNGNLPASMGIRLLPGDVVTLDDQRIDWEDLYHHPSTTTTKEEPVKESNNKKHHRAQESQQQQPLQQQIQQNQQQHHVYIKYWKPRGVECTTDRRVRNNILDALGDDDILQPWQRRRRIWPMGRLDKDSTGLILLTSDGTTTQRVLKSSGSSNNDDDDDDDDENDHEHNGSRRRHWKTYWVETDRRATNQDLQKLANGVRILAPTSRDGINKAQWVTTRTDAIITRRQLPRNNGNNNSSSSSNCRIDNQLIFTICEGKNRQIRRMCETIGLTVVKLHRVEFAGITLAGCPRPGTWAFLTRPEVDRLLLL